ncbi:hypothetical protein GCM10009801_37260 [Streptomyces albiaxialis]|uniref:GDT1 family protein n=2 Tax=Streptomyces TaxID=1883 RepID=A0ABN2W1B7_9ACTN
MVTGGATATALASGLVTHLLLDRLLKAGIVLAALLVLAIGMTVVWRRTGTGPRDRD